MGLPEGNVQKNNSKIGTVNEQASIHTLGGAKKVEHIVDSKPNTVPDSNPPDVYGYPDSEFHDFDKHKSENYFAVDQI